MTSVKESFVWFKKILRMILEGMKEQDFRFHRMESEFVFNFYKHLTRLEDLILSPYPIAEAERGADNCPTGLHYRQSVRIRLPRPPCSHIVSTVEPTRSFGTIPQGVSPCPCTSAKRWSSKAAIWPTFPTSIC